MAGIFILLVALVVVLGGAGIYASNYVAHYRNRRDPDRWLDNLQYYQDCERLDVEITSCGMRIVGEYLPCPHNAQSGKVAVLVHGVTATRRTVSDYIPLFHQCGYQVLIYDQPGHGKSEGTLCSYGFYERRVLLDWMGHLEKHYAMRSFGLWGISMGAATVLRAAPDCWPVFVIADCSFDSFLAQFENQLRSFSVFPKRFAHGFACYVSWLNRLLRGWSFQDCAPIRSIDSIKAPVLFIHGTKDGFVRKEMSMRMFDRRQEQGLPTQLAFFEAGHAASFYSDKPHYCEVVTRFVGDCEKSSNQPAS